MHTYIYNYYYYITIFFILNKKNIITMNLTICINIISINVNIIYYLQIASNV